MPRGKYVNHKGRCRQFTPSEQLQQELGMIMEKEQVPDLNHGNGEPSKNDDEKNSASRLHNLIQVSNPNRLPRELPHERPMMKQEADKSKKDRGREERKQKQGPRSSQVQADLERLSIVRREREAAAERRLAAKKAAAEADASRMVSALKKIPKQCPVGEVNSPKGLVLRGK